MSVSKPFVFALVCQTMGAEEVREKLGVNATGLAFNSLGRASSEGTTARRTRWSTREPSPPPAWCRAPPTRRSGSSSTTGCRASPAARLPLNDEVYASASETNFRNQSIARLLQSYGRIYMDPAEATDLYTKQCSLNVTAKDLAVMGATLADGGVNPITKERVVDADSCHYALAVMATAGLYETSGDWLFDIGLPGKSGIGGGIVTVSPGKGGLGTFAPPLDAPATASRDSSWPSSCPSGWEWTCSSRSLKCERTGRPP